MGRFISGAGGSSGTGGSAPVINTVLTAGEPVQQGDIITLGGDGLGYWAMDPVKVVAGAALRPIAAAVAASFLTLAPTSATTLVASQQVSLSGDCQSAVLTNGNIVHTWCCATAPYNSVFMITDPVGGTVVPPTNGPVNSSSGNVAVCALTGGGFVLATVSQASGLNTYFTVYDNNANVTVATTRFGTGALVGIGSYSVLTLLALSNGNFAMAADLGGGGANYVPYLGVFTPAGAAVRAPAQVVAPVAAGGPGSNTSCLIQLTGGGFALICSTADGTNVTARFLTYNAAGVQQGAGVNGRTRVNGVGSLRAVALQNGGWMAAEISNASWVPFVYIFNAGGVQQGAAITDFDTAPANATALCNLVLLSSGNVFMSYVGGAASNNISAFVLSPAGAKLAGTGPSGNVIGSGAYSIAPVAISLGNDAVGMYPGVGSVMKSYKFASGAISPYLADGAITYSAGNNGTRLIPLKFTNAPAGSVTFMSVGLQAATVAVDTRVLARQVYTPIGVATASAAGGSAVPVQITGNVTLRLGFVQPFVLDANGAPTPGQRMSVVGNQAILNGMQPNPVGRRQIN
nr:hypothetical protein [uncultured Duganella sp.]